MSKSKIIIIIALAVVLAMNFFLKPYLHKLQAKKIVRTVLDLWSEGDLAENFKYWQDQNKSPPVFGVDEYTINDSKFTKTGKDYRAQYYVTIDFASGNTVPDNKEWIFTLKKIQSSWLIVDFQLSDS